MNKETSFSIENLKNRLLSNEPIIGAVKNICQMIKKRSAIILTLFLLIINPALFGQLVDIICGVFNKTSYLFPVAVIETVVSIVILIKVSKRLCTRRDALYFCVLLEFIFRIGFNVDFIKTSTYTLVLSVIILILFMRKELILFIPFISLAANLSDFQFVNEFLISRIIKLFEGLPSVMRGSREGLLLF